MSKVEAKADFSDVMAGLDSLLGPMRGQLASSMAVAGGKVIRDEAKVLAPKDSGKLAAAIYVARKDKLSTEKQVVYSVTWNKKKAPHGHLLEDGHWQPYVVIKINGEYVTTSQLLKQPKWVAARPFMRPAYDSAKDRAMQAMYRRGRERLPELLAGKGGDDES